MMCRCLSFMVMVMTQISSLCSVVIDNDGNGSRSLALSCRYFDDDGDDDDDNSGFFAVSYFS